MVLADGLQYLDELALRGLWLMNEIITEREQLNSLLKSGFINMAQARYVLGNSAVSELKFPARMSACYVVDSETRDIRQNLDLYDEIAEGRGGNGAGDSAFVGQGPSFTHRTLVRADVSSARNADSDGDDGALVGEMNGRGDVAVERRTTTTSESAKGSDDEDDRRSQSIKAGDGGDGDDHLGGKKDDDGESPNAGAGGGLRRRNVQRSAIVEADNTRDRGDGGRTTASSKSDLEEVSSEGDDKPKTVGNSTPGDGKLPKFAPKSDPLRWFGVLVPSTLRRSQMEFRRAVESSVRLVNYQEELISVVADYRRAKSVAQSEASEE